MALLVWSDALQLGLPEIDAHHRHLVDLLNETHNLVAAGAAAEKIGGILDQLVNYATYHFLAEERLMEAYSYPLFKEHHEEHERFTTRIVEIQTRFHENQQDISMEVLVFLKNWLINHILKRDAGYGQYIGSVKNPM